MMRDYVGVQVRALGHGAADDGRRRRRERQLKDVGGVERTHLVLGGT